MRNSYGVNLLAVSRKDRKIHKRLGNVIFRIGDVLMLHGRSHNIGQAISSMGCLPLVQRGLRIGFEKKMVLALSIFLIAIAIVVSRILPVHVAFTMAAGAIVLSGVLPIKDIYDSIDWPVIVLLGAMLPVGEALETSGGAALIASNILQIANTIPVWATLSILLAVTMLLSDIINNAATVVLMAPIGISIANGLGLSVDPFLMAIAVGGSTAFLTPIGHQSNILVMGPGGYRFGDYFRMGLPLSILILLITVPLILYFWPF
jgi:di/tricarboxylate transporter